MRPSSRGFHARTAFTLIELMLVVMILGVLAGIAVMASGNPVSESKQTALALTLRQVRGQLMLYTVQHDNTPPAAENLHAALLGTTDVAGNPGTGSLYPLGPYLMTFPRNPFNGRNDVKAVAAGSAVVPDNATGWLYQVNQGDVVFVANTPGNDTAGKPIASY